MATLDNLKNVRFVLDASGKKSAVQVSMKDWQTILDYLEEVEDRADARELLARLRQGPEKAGASAWQKAKGEW